MATKQKPNNKHNTCRTKQSIQTHPSNREHDLVSVVRRQFEVHVSAVPFGNTRDLLFGAYHSKKNWPGPQESSSDFCYCA